MVDRNETRRNRIGRVLIILLVLIGDGCEKRVSKEDAFGPASNETENTQSWRRESVPDKEVPTVSNSIVNSNKEPLEMDRHLSVWRSPDSPPDRKVEAVRKLIKVGTSVADVQQTLGRGTWTRRHGIQLNFTTNSGQLVGEPAGDFSESSLDYEVPEGWISLSFDKPSDEGRFVSVSFRKHVNLGEAVN